MVMGVLGISSSASALPYSYDFSTFAVEGQSFEGATLGVMTLTSQSGDLKYTNSYGGGIAGNIAGGAAADINLAFSTPISQIAVRGGDGSGDSDAFSLYLYEFATNNLLGRFDTPVFGGANEPEWYTLSVPFANIGRVVIDPGNSGILPGVWPGSGGVVVTDINYTTGASVPEPYTLLLLGSGLIGLVAVRKKMA